MPEGIAAYSGCKAGINFVIKIAARVTELVTRIKVSLPSSYPYKQDLARFAGRAQALPP